MPQADALQPRVRPRAGVACAAQLERQHHVLERGERRQQLKGLEHESKQPLAQRGARVFVEPRQRHAVERYVARGRAVETREQPEQSRLARTGCANDGHGIAGIHREGHVIQDDEGRVAALHDLGQRVGANEGLWHGGSAPMRWHVRAPRAACKGTGVGPL